MNSRPIDPDRIRAADAYSAAHRGLALLILHHGELLWENHAEGHPSDQPLPIASGTKSFAGVLAAVAAGDGFLDLDAPAANTLTEWQTDARKSQITVRQLLQLVSGLDGGGKAGHRIEFAAALNTPAVTPPGTRFLYGTAPFQAFGELARRRLDVVCADPLDYLHGRVLDRIGLETGRWRRGTDGWPDFSSGLNLTARHWAKLGEWIRQGGRWDGVAIVPQTVLDECFVSSTPNPAYGLGWWLNRALPHDSHLDRKHTSLGLEDLTSEPAVPSDLVYAAGAGKQRLFISRSHSLVIVRQAAGVLEALAGGEHSSFSDRAFFRILLGEGSDR